MKYCSKCGNEVLDEAVVCPKCGCSVDYEKVSTYSQSSRSQTNGFAIAGFVCSFFIPLLGWIFGGIGLSKAKKTDGKGKGFSTAAIAIATVVFLIYFIYFIIMKINHRVYYFYFI